ncbi:RNA recognition motif [Gracilaria domingensis]|nr:RNA recognition motif [Gracilaria domingensis]
MSRLIIKGLPTRYKDDNLRELCSFAGEVTDAKVIYTRDGKSRQFGFVGFRTPQAARVAKSRLHKSFVDTSRVTVEQARTVGAEDLPRPWSKYSKGSSRFEKQNDKQEEKERKQFLNEEKERLRRLRAETQRVDEQKTSSRGKQALSEGNSEVWNAFQEVARPRAANPVWADGNVRAKVTKTLVQSRKHGGQGKLLERNHMTFGDSDEEDHMYEDLPKVDVEEKPDEVGDEIALDHQVSDMDYFKSKIVGNDLNGEDVVENDDSQSTDSQSDGSKDSEEDSDEEDDLGSEVGDEKELVGEAESPREVPFGNAKKREKKTSKVDEKSEPTRNGKTHESDGVDVSETGRLLVRNIAFSVSEEDLERIFEPFGVLAEVHVVRDKATLQSRGIAFVQFMNHEDAVRAITSLDGTFQTGRIMHILPAKPKREHLPTRKREVATGSSSFKEKRASEQREAAQKGLDSVSQDPMHVSANAVADIVAERHGVSKAELLGTRQGESGVAAVRLAMAEATVQSETQKYLAERGVNLTTAVHIAKEIAANTTIAKRKRLSRTAFLVKNLPARTRETDLKQVFLNYGSLARLIVVPSGLLAVVEFKTATDAKRAYNNLAYTRFRDAPLYLEWLPSEALEPSSLREAPSNSGEPDEEKERLKTRITEENDTVENVSSVSTVYVKNLNFSTRNDQLKEHFLSALRKRPHLVKSLRSTKVAMKRGVAGKESDTLSMGFGFLEFAYRSDALEAVKVAQNTTLDGHTLQLRISNPNGNNPTQPSGKRRKASGKKTKISPKLIVRNLAFEATRRDVRQLFSSFGQLKTVRLPRKADGSHRGFAFVEFVSKSEAKTAYEALESAHLYGRHLVVEYAEEGSPLGSTIEELQEKTAIHVVKRLRLNNGLAADLHTGEGGDNERDEDERARDEMYA